MRKKEIEKRERKQDKKIRETDRQVERESLPLEHMPVYQHENIGISRAGLE